MSGFTWLTSVISEQLMLQEQHFHLEMLVSALIQGFFYLTSPLTVLQYNQCFNPIT